MIRLIVVESIVKTFEFVVGLISEGFEHAEHFRLVCRTNLSNYFLAIGSGGDVASNVSFLHVINEGQGIVAVFLVLRHLFNEFIECFEDLFFFHHRKSPRSIDQSFDRVVIF